MCAQKKKTDKAPEHPPNGAPAKLSFFPAWCKRCGNCVAFCPRKALGTDEWGYPRLEKPDRCTSCGLCEMLCPDFAIGVGEPSQAAGPAPAQSAAPATGQPAPFSPERLAPDFQQEEKDKDGQEQG